MRAVAHTIWNKTLPALDSRSPTHPISSSMTTGSIRKTGMGTVEVWVPIKTGNSGYRPCSRAVARWLSYSPPTSVASDNTTEMTTSRSAAASPPGTWVKV